jgi:hypothetical protein
MEEALLLACLFFFPLKWNNAVQDQARHGRLYRQQSQLSRLPSLLFTGEEMKEKCVSSSSSAAAAVSNLRENGRLSLLAVKGLFGCQWRQPPNCNSRELYNHQTNCEWTWREYLSMRVFPSYPRHQPSNYFRRRHANVRLHHTDSTSVFSCWTLWNYLLFLLQCFTDIAAAKALLGAPSASGWGDVACVAWNDSMRRPIQHRPLFPSINICTGSAHV